MTVVADSRERYTDRIKELLTNYPPSMVASCPKFEFRCLGKDLGDYLLTNGDRELAVERKSMSDFCSTYTHLKERLHVMRLHYQNVALLLENPYTVSNNTIYILEGNQFVPRIEYQTFSNFLTHQASLGTWIFQTMSFEESIHRLIAIHNYLPKLDAPTASLKCGSPTEWIIQLPKMGPKKVAVLRNKYESPMIAIEQCDEWMPEQTKKLLSDW
jgi:ERCC4-type nuclease